MEEEKLLRGLVLFLTILSLYSIQIKAFAVSGDEVAIKENIEIEENIDFANHLSMRGKKEIIEQSKAAIKEFLEKNPNNHLNIANDFSLEAKPILKIFVSTSMPVSLLKSYFREASKYNGILVFKGLPNGSFKELVKLITSFEEDVKKSILSKSKPQIASAIIDDESFKKYGVQRVPTIVLAKENDELEEECLERMSCRTIYDKVTGNIGIRSALEEFEKSGELNSFASGMLIKLSESGDRR